MSQSMVNEAYARPMPKTMVFDCEVISDWENVPERAREILWQKWREAEAKRPPEQRGDPKNDPEMGAALNPWCGRLVSLAMFEPTAGKGRCVYVRNSDVLPMHPGWTFTPVASERELLEDFWRVLDRNPGVRLAGYNSRSYDAMFLFVRSFLHGVRCTRNVLSHRYSPRPHTDLMDCLSGWGATRPVSLDFAAAMCGFESSKDDISGADVDAVWRRGEDFRVAVYNARDTMVTAKLLGLWDGSVGPVFAQRDVT